VKLEPWQKRMALEERKRHKFALAYCRSYRLGGRQPNDRQSAVIQYQFHQGRLGQLVDYCLRYNINPNKTIAAIVNT
jgi:hypothetical protein